MRGALLACCLFAGTALGQESSYSVAVNAQLDCADAYVAQGLRMNWNATAGDLVDAALSSCEDKTQDLERAIVKSKVLQIDSDAARELVRDITANLRLTLVQHVVEYRNKPAPQPK